MEFAQDQPMTRKAVRCNHVLVFGDLGPVGLHVVLFALTTVIAFFVVLVQNLEQDLKLKLRAQVDYAQVQGLIPNLALCNLAQVNIQSIKTVLNGKVI